MHKGSSSIIWCMCTVVMLAGCGLLLCMTSACSGDNDDTLFPPLVTELVDLKTDGNKMGVSITNDDGKTYSIASTRLSTDVSDTIVRCFCTYASENGNDATLYDIRAVYAGIPIPSDHLQSHEKDPLRIISSWQTARYMNFQLAFLTTKTSSHGIIFCEDSLTVSPEGARMMHATLIHRRGEKDEESFTERFFVCLPLHLLRERVDSVRLTIPTYKGDSIFGIAVSSSAADPS